MKALIAVFAVFAVALVGMIGFIAEDSRKGPTTENGIRLVPPGSAAPRDAVPTHDVRTISHGERVDFADHLDPGMLTVFDFTADW